MADSPENSAEFAEDRASLRRVQEELRRVEQIVTELTGLPSNWNGNVELHADAAWRGAKPFRCDILLDAARQLEDVRWRTHLHEMLHAHSAGYTRYAFDAFPGWEEGVVEKLQRLLRPEVLARLGLEIPESDFAEEEAVHEFNSYMQALDSLYRLVQHPGEHEPDFYIVLLGTPLGQRMAGVMERGKTLPPAERATFLRAFAQASVILRNPPRP